MSNLHELVDRFKALADPTRLRLAALIVERPRCGQDLASELGISTPTVSHHLRVLRAAGLLRETRQTPYRFFELDLSALQAAVKAVSDRKTAREIAASGAVPDADRKVLRAFFDGPRLLAIPAQRRKKEIVFEEILRRLPRRKEYGERELSRYIESFHPDFCTIRREFIMGGYMVREAGQYRLTDRGRAVVTRCPVS
jgi:DNA-binding transcriptional ArsR family regulator